jgi:hypothetical protein
MSAHRVRATDDEQRPCGIEDMFDGAQDAARGLREAEEALEVVRQRFERTEDEGARDQLAAEALEHVERQLALARERRRQLDSVEAKLWARRNRIERLLIHARGSDWWRARRGPRQAEAASR